VVVEEVAVNEVVCPMATTLEVEMATTEAVLRITTGITWVEVAVSTAVAVEETTEVGRCV
jgi:hypothetical protein